MIDRFISWLYTRRLFGPRCLDYEPECACCEAWAAHDGIFHDGPEPETKARLALFADLADNKERPMTGFLTGLTDEQKLKVLGYDGDIRVSSGEGGGRAENQGSARAD